jgi:hypothetical protein
MKMKREVILIILLLSLITGRMTGQITGASITGVFNVGTGLTASYTGSPEAGNHVDFEWFYSPATSIGTGPAYTILPADQGFDIYVKATENVDGTHANIRDYSSGQTKVNSYPVAAYVSISGVPRSGMTLTGSYVYYDADGDPDISTFKWFTGTSPGGAGATQIGSATAQSFILSNSEIGLYIGFYVTPGTATGSTPGSEVATSVWIGPVTANTPPTATIQAITGTKNVGEALTGHYIYSDAEGDLENGSMYQWYSSPTSGGALSPVSGGISHVVEMSEQGYYFKFEVTPIALTGAITGSTTPLSAEYGAANTKPYIVGGSVTISGTTTVGSELTGDYDYSDVDGDLEGYSTFRWLRGGVPISGATAINYTLTSADDGYKITFEGTPVSITGYPNTGTPVLSAETGTITNPSDPGPVASEVCIQGKRAIGEVLTGNYLYTYAPKREGNSVYQWYRNGSPISPGGDGIHYTMTAADVNAEIKFGVIPKSVSPVKTGAQALSYDLVKITIPQDIYSVAVDTVKLTASINGGVFSGPGVTNGIFSPSSVGVRVAPYRIEYFHDTVFANYTTCTQQAIKDITVESNVTKFADVPVLCHDRTSYKIVIEAIPVGAVPYFGYGFFFNLDPYFWYNFSLGTYTYYHGAGVTDPRIISYELGGGAPYVNDATTPWTVTIDPGKLSVGSVPDILYLYYNVGGYYYLLQQPLNVEEAPTVTRITNLNLAYCIDALPQTISIEGASPVKGKAIWSADNILLPGDKIMNQADTTLTTSVIRPALGTAGQTYLVTYQYKSTNGCYSVPVSGNVLINPLPDTTFTLNKTYNVDGDAIILKNILPPGGSFTGNGVSGNKLFPDIAGTGNDIITYKITDSVTKCYNSNPRTTLIRKAQGDFGTLPSVICYRDTTYSIQIKSLTGTITNDLIKNTKKTIVYTAGTFKADYDITEAGAGTDTITFSYTWDLDDYTISKIVNIDSLGQVAIKNLFPGDGVCNNVEPFELFTTHSGGIYTGPVVGGYLDPSKATGPVSVAYLYTNQKTGCYTRTVVPITIFPAPAVSFVPKDVCIENSADSTFFTNTTTSSDPVQSWLWEFSESGVSGFSSKKAPGNLFKTGGYHLVTLTATTTNNCSAGKAVSLDLGVKPVADFYWENECFKANDNLRLYDNTNSFSSIVSRSWNFFDGDSLHKIKNPTYSKKSAGFLPVELIVNTKYPNCNDTILRKILIRPTVILGNDNYFEDFEAGNGSWIKDDQVRNSWTFGTPDRNSISYAASGNNAWFTKFDVSSQKIESSSVVSPCFDFRNIERPMITLKLWKRFERNRDGAALQYKIGDKGNWEYLGTLNDGINWFNSTLIKGRPGGDQIGWTNDNTPDSTWIVASHKLDALKGKQDVKLRIAYGSDGTSADNEGVAFDDIWIGERTRNVLFEHFTNSSSTAGRSSNVIVNAAASQIEKDVINIQYHTNFPGSDLFYSDNPDDASGRILYYGLSKTPYSMIDGGTRTNYSNVYDYSIANLDTNDLNRRSLINPSFSIALSTEVNGGILSVNTNVTALENLNEENVTLYLAVTAKEIRLDNATPNGEKTFRNVFRKMIPDAGGFDMKKVWTKGDVVPLNEKTWTIEKVYNASDIEVIAYIQNNITKEIYQTEIKSQNIGVVGIEKLFGKTGPQFALYPNPATDRITLLFDKMPESGTNIWIYDFTGTVLKMYKTGSRQMEHSIDDLNLSNGLYLIKVFSEIFDFGYMKLVISGK